MTPSRHHLLFAITFLERLKETIILNNSLWIWAIAVIVLVCAFVISRLLPVLFRRVIKRFYRRTDNELQEFDQPLRTSFLFLMFSIAFHILKTLLHTSDSIESTMSALIRTAYILSISIFAYTLIPLFFKYGSRRGRNLIGDPKRSDTLAHYSTLLIKVLIIVFAAVAVFSVWGVNVSGILTGLGIGGLAISLAAQDTLSNLIGGVTIMADHPFEIGDFVRIGTNEGTIEEIGFRSTKMRTLDGFLVVIPNSLVVNDSLVNITRMNKRRVRIELMIRRDTPAGTVKQFVDRLGSLVRSRERAMAEGILVALHGVSGTAQVILVQYYIENTDYGVFTQEQEQLLHEINLLQEECGIRPVDPLARRLET